MRASSSAVIALAGAAAAGCIATVTGQLEVDRAPFVTQECRTGAAAGFFPGVQLTDANGQRLRLYSPPPGHSGAALVSISRAGSDVWDAVGPCGVMTFDWQLSRVWSHRNFKGSATLACQRNGREVSGQIDFKNCH